MTPQEVVGRKKKISKKENLLVRKGGEKTFPKPYTTADPAPDWKWYQEQTNSSENNQQGKKKANLRKSHRKTWRE